MDMDVLLAWTPGHDAELDFNRRKRHAKRIEAYHAKSLLPGEVDEELVREALANQDTLTKARRTRANQEARQSLHFQGRRLSSPGKPSTSQTTFARPFWTDGSPPWG